MYDVSVVIPARLASTRFPRKVLAKVEGTTVLGMVVEAAKACSRVDRVYVATPDEELVKYADLIPKVRSILTDPQPTVLDCVSNAVTKPKFHKSRYVVVVQGDEPLVTPGMIDDVIRTLPVLQRNCLVAPVFDRVGISDPNMVKVIMGTTRRIMYLSREPIPGLTPEGDRGAEGVYYKQVCVMGFDFSTIENFSRIPRTPAEQQEGIDLLRLVLDGHSVYGVNSYTKTQAVDAPEDLETIREILKLREREKEEEHAC